MIKSAPVELETLLINTCAILVQTLEFGAGEVLPHIEDGDIWENRALEVKIKSLISGRRIVRCWRRRGLPT